MIITQIQLSDFRNYQTLTLAPAPGINLLAGKNAQGKTNLLEAVYLCCVGKSLRGKDKELIRAGRPGAHVVVTVQKTYAATDLAVTVPENDRKKITVDGIPLLKIGELMGCLNAVFFAPDELKLIKDAPQLRRRFMDIDISQTDKRYFYALLNYNDILLKRNNVLKSGNKQLHGLLDVYDEQLARYGGLILQKRKTFIAALAAPAAAVHKRLTETETLHVAYRSSCAGDDPAAALLKALNAAREKDLNLGYTTAGPHRDDLEILCDGLDVRVYGSQGQQRTCALSLKLAELSHFTELTGEKPLLLLDDVFSELDAGRRARLLECCEGYQTFISATDVPEGGRITVYNVSAGSIERK